MEEHKDRERARGALDELQKKKGGQHLGLQGEVAALQKDLHDLRKEYNQAKTKNAREEGRPKNEIETLRTVMEKLKNEIERLSSERDDLKNEVERKGVLKQQKKEFQKLKLQVTQLAIAFSTDIVHGCFLVETSYREHVAYQ